MEIINDSDQERIVQAISLAESRTSGEMRLVVERKLKAGDAIARATSFFEKLDMHKTALRNGILIYLAVDDHELAVIGDAGIHQRVSDAFWQTVRDHMVEHFRKGEITNGLLAGIAELGEQLAHYFPRKDDDINELPNDIYFGKN